MTIIDTYQQMIFEGLNSEMILKRCRIRVTRFNSIFKIEVSFPKDLVRFLNMGYLKNNGYRIKERNQNIYLMKREISHYEKQLEEKLWIVALGGQN